MKKSQMKGIVITAGVIVAFLLMRFLKIQPPIGKYFSGETLSYLLFALFSLIFSPLVGGAVGLLSRIYIIVTAPNFVDSIKFLPLYIPNNMVFPILLTGLYGFVIGKLFEKRPIKADSNKNAVLNIGLFSLLSAGLFIVVQILNRFLVFIYLKLLVQVHVFRSSNYTLLNPDLLMQFLKRSLIIGGIGFAIVFFCYKCVKINIPFFPAESQEEILPETSSESRFDGGLLSYVGWSILGFFVTVLTLGICYPWALCMKYGWRINHTKIDGRRLKFVGSAISLFGHWLLWLLLCIITLGIYIWWLPIALEKWKVRNTTFAEWFVNGKSVTDTVTSDFDGGLLSYIGWIIAGFFVTVLTLGICYPWALCMKYGWRINHTKINGRRLKFTGSAINLFGHWILWLVLCIVTFGIYAFWLFIALEKWKVKNTTFAD